MIGITLCKIAKIKLNLKQIFQYSRKLILIIAIIILSNDISFGQDSLQVDTFQVSVLDTNNVPRDSVKSNSTIEHTINYTAKDSIWFDVQNQIAFLYGEAHVDYGDLELNADIIQIDYKLHLLKATYSVDTTSEKGKKGVPHFKSGKDEYDADSIAYNYETEKGYITGVYTQTQNNHLTGEGGLKDKENNLYIKNAKFCPCDDPDAGTFIKTKRLKIIPDKRIISGPAMLHIGNIPTPLAVPFGIFPLNAQRTSGIVFPNYSYNPIRGYYLSDGGFYWAMNEYIDLKATGTIYSKGGGGISLGTNYNNRYAYKGDAKFHYTSRVTNGDEYLRTEEDNFQFNWNHTPAGLSGRKLNANVNLESTQYRYRNEMEPNAALQSNTNSNISYSLPMKGTPLSANFKLRHSQNNQSGFYDFTLPSANLSLQRMYPLKRKSPYYFNNNSAKAIQDFTQSIAFTSNSFNFSQRVSNAPVNSAFPFEVVNASTRAKDTLSITDDIDEVFKRNKIDMDYGTTLSGTIKLLNKNLRITPSMGYTGYLYTRKFNYTEAFYNKGVDTTIYAYKVDTINTLAHAYKYNTSINASTTIYGLYRFANPKLPRFRHTMNPNLGFSYSPDFTDEERFGYYTTYKNAKGIDQTVSYYQGMTTPNGTLQKTASFSLNNTLEMKNQTSSDTTNQEKATAKTILKSFNLSSSYNFAQDSNKLAPINFIASADLLKNIINLTVQGTMDPYEYIYDTTSTSYQKRLGTYAYSESKNLGNITSIQVRVGFTISQTTFNDFTGDFEKNRQEKLSKKGYEYYQIPWSVTLSYNYNKRRIGFYERRDSYEDPSVEFSTNQALSLNGNFNLTENWRFNWSLQYDLETKRFFSPYLSIYRDLGCWEMRATWVPFGTRQSYSFGINIKSPILKDLKYNKARSWPDK